MYFKYGAFQHDNNQVNISTISKEKFYSPRNRLFYWQETWVIEGDLIAYTESGIKTLIDELNTAYYEDLVDATLYHSDGTKSAHQLVNQDAINGVRVKRIAFPSGDPGEYATGRVFQIVLQAEFVPPPGSIDQIYSFEETVQTIGTCGPSWELVTHKNGPPEAVQTSEWTTQSIIQAGEVVGIDAQVGALPPPLLPWNYEHFERRMVQRGSAQKIGVHGKTLYPLKYRYEFSSGIEKFPIPWTDYPRY